MDGYSIAAWFVLVLVVVGGAGLVVFLASLPGRIARQRKHPCAEAVQVAGWLTFFLGFALWPLAVIWAYLDIPAAGGRAEP